MKKKITSILLVAAMSTSVLTGCNSTSTKDKESTKQEVAEVTAKDQEKVDLLEDYEVLQGEEDGSYKSDYYLGTGVDTVTWGRRPNKDSKPALTVESGATVTIDTLSHEGVLEDQEMS